MYLHAELLVQQLRRNLPRQLQLFPVQVEGQVSQCEVGGVSVRCHDHQGGLAQVQFFVSGDMPVVVATWHGVLSF